MVGTILSSSQQLLCVQYDIRRCLGMSQMIQQEMFLVKSSGNKHFSVVILCVFLQHELSEISWLAFVQV